MGPNIAATLSIVSGEVSGFFSVFINNNKRTSLTMIT